MRTTLALGLLGRNRAGLGSADAGAENSLGEAHQLGLEWRVALDRVARRRVQTNRKVAEQQTAEDHTDEAEVQVELNEHPRPEPRVRAIGLASTKPHHLRADATPA